MIITAFILLAFGPLVADMYHRRDGITTLRTAITWSCIYISSALLFALVLLLLKGSTESMLFLSGWAIEKSLSVDNLLVFGAIFAYFGVAPKCQYRVLHIGIVGSVILRFLFVTLGLFLFFIFGRILDIAFGVFVIWTASKIETSGDSSPIDHNTRWYIRWTKRIIPVSAEESERFFIRKPFKWIKACPTATPLFLCLVSIEITDIIFAFDSVPAVIGITRTTLLAYSSIMFAVIGLRSLYFVLEGLLKYTEHLQSAIMVALLYIGLKLIIHGIFNYDLPAFLTFVVVVLAVSYAFLFAYLKHPISEVK